MSYATRDFSESLTRVGINKADIATVIAAWGYGDGMGGDKGRVPGHVSEEDSVTDWQGGFLMQMRDGRIVYLTGWCDYTGWGCQDGANMAEFDATPDLSTLRVSAVQRWSSEEDPVPDEQWDREPADLNRWLRAEED